MIIWNPVCREDRWSLIQLSTLLYHLYNGYSSSPFPFFLKKKIHECIFIRSTHALCFSSILSLPAGSGQRTVWGDQLNRWSMIHFTTFISQLLSSTIIHSFVFSAWPSGYFRCPRVSRISISDQKVWHGVCKQREPFKHVRWRLWRWNHRRMQARGHLSTSYLLTTAGSAQLEVR